jgi:hypothetical protein
MGLSVFHQSPVTSHQSPITIHESHITQNKETSCALLLHCVRYRRVKKVWIPCQKRNQK